MIRIAGPALLFCLAGCNLSGSDSGRQQNGEPKTGVSVRDAPASAPTSGTQTSGPGAPGGIGGIGGPAPASSTPGSSQQTADAAVGTWRGSYTCPQGTTGLDIVLERDGADRLRGTFRFYPLPQNPSVPRGCFTLTATAGPSGRLRTYAGNWITHPPDYLLGDVDGVINSDGTWSGNLITGGQCGGFLLRKVTEAPEAC